MRYFRSISRQRPAEAQLDTPTQKLGLATALLDFLVAIRDIGVAKEESSAVS